MFLLLQWLSVPLGASVIEKHFTLSRADGGVDSVFSLEPHELKALVVESERAWQALGQVSYGSTDAELNSLAVRRSIYASNDISAGDLFTIGNICIVRLGDGGPPHLHSKLLGRVLLRSYAHGTPLSIDDLL